MPGGLQLVSIPHAPPPCLLPSAALEPMEMPGLAPWSGGHANRTASSRAPMLDEPGGAEVLLPSRFPSPPIMWALTPFTQHLWWDEAVSVPVTPQCDTGAPSSRHNPRWKGARYHPADINQRARKEKPLTSTCSSYVLFNGSKKTRHTTCSLTTAFTVYSSGVLTATTLCIRGL